MWSEEDGQSQQESRPLSQQESLRQSYNLKALFQTESLPVPSKAVDPDGSLGIPNAGQLS